MMNAAPAGVMTGAAAENHAGKNGAEAEEIVNKNSRPIPYTGDSSNLPLWAGLFAAAGLADAIIILQKIRSGRS